jgi:polyhydroxyalkanoate synthesis regulator protein
MQDMVGEFLSRSFDAFVTQQKQFQQQMRAAMAATPLATIQELTASNLKAWQAMQDALLDKNKDKDED